MSGAAARRHWWAGDSPRETVVFAAVLVTVLFGGLSVLHALFLDGAARMVMPVVAVASTLVAAAVAVAARRRLPDSGLPLALAGLSSLLLVNPIVYLAVSGDLRQTAPTMLTIVAVGAVVPARLAIPLVGLALAAWATVVVLQDLGPVEDVYHYGLGLVFASLLAFVVHEIGARTQRRLRRIREDLDAVMAVARCGQAGTDPRPVVVGAVLELADAHAVGWVEDEADDLVVVLSAGLDVDGVRITKDSTSATARCWATGEPVLVPDAAASPRLPGGHRGGDPGRRGRSRDGRDPAAGAAGGPGHDRHDDRHREPPRREPGGSTSSPLWPAGPGSRSPWPWRTWTAARPTTTPSATTPGTCCSASSPTAPARCSARST